MILIGVVLIGIGLVTLILPSYGAEFFVMEALAESLSISPEVLSMLLAVMGAALVFARVILGIVRDLKRRATARSGSKDQI